jgi:hypothetical protein
MLLKSTLTKQATCLICLQTKYENRNKKIRKADRNEGRKRKGPRMVERRDK